MKKVHENKYLIGLWLLTAAALFFFIGHCSNIIIDVGREVYYPVQILKGKVLYQDLFNIYGPFSYLFNAALFKIFGAKLSTLYGAGIVSSFLIVTAVYMIAKRFLSEFLSCSAAVLTIVTGITSPLIFNFTFPYSWAMVYGLICFLYSLYFLLKSEDKETYIYLSAFLAGISVSNKYEFVLYGVFVLAYAFTKSFSIGFKSIAAFLAAPIFSFAILMAQGLKIPSLINTFIITKEMAKSRTLAYFYQNTGIFYHQKTLPYIFISFLKTAVPFAGIIYGIHIFNKNKWLAPLSAAVFTVLALKGCNTVFFFVPFALIVFSLFSINKLRENKPLLILVISALLVSLKFFWGLLDGSYGTYVLSPLLIAFFALLFTYLPKNLEKGGAVLLLIYSLICLNGNLSYKYKQVDNLYLYTNNGLAKSTTELLDFIKTQTKPSDRVVIFPEGLMINFLAERNSDNLYNSLIPLYIEVLGEDRIINHFNETKPEYIIFNNQTTADYGFPYICQDYARDFCGFVSRNYTQAAVFSNGFNYLVYKLK